MLRLLTRFKVLVGVAEGRFEHLVEVLSEPCELVHELLRELFSISLGQEEVVGGKVVRKVHASGARKSLTIVVALLSSIDVVESFHLRSDPAHTRSARVEVIVALVVVRQRVQQLFKQLQLCRPLFDPLLDHSHRFDQC